MKIVLDVYGGDKAPDEILIGAAEALKARRDLGLVLVGREDVIGAYFNNMKGHIDASRIEIIDAREIVTNDDVPTTAIKSKKDSSLVKALSLLKERDDICGMVSAGSTGAVLTGAVLKVGRMDGVARPALAPVLPTLTGGNVCLVDCGANVDCRPEYLAHFALMGSAYMKSVYGIKNPRVALLSNGAEEKKGNELNKEAFPLLKALPINFVGNMEARYALTGEFDVIVTDGFAGNVLLKSVEGTASMVMKSLKKAIMGSASAKLGALFMKKAFRQLKSDMDYNAKGGAPFLGVSKIIIKSHGSSDLVAIKASILQACTMYENKLIENIKSELAKLEKAKNEAVTEPIAPAAAEAFQAASKAHSKEGGKKTPPSAAKDKSAVEETGKTAGARTEAVTADTEISENVTKE